MNTITKNTTISVGALVALFSIFSWFTDKIDTKAGKEEVEKVEVKVEKAKDEIHENEKIDLRQTILIEQISGTLDRLDKKIDKELAK